MGRSFGGIFKRSVSPDAVILFERNQPCPVWCAGQGFGIGFFLAAQTLAVCTKQVAHFDLDQVDQTAADLVRRDDQPMPVIRHSV